MNLLSQLRKKTSDMPGNSLSRHNEFINEFLRWADARPVADGTARQVTILARSPLSPAAAAILARSEELKQRGIGVRAIFAELGPENAMPGFCEELDEINGEATAREHIRWARNSCLRDAHEQLILGDEMCWSGDCMRREPGKRNSLDLFETGAAQTVRLGALAFDAIWTISEILPASATNRAAPARPSGAYAAGHEERLSGFSFLRKGGRINPLAH